jgi:hypothetical protein
MLVSKKNEIMSFAAKWMEMKIIMLSEISQSHKDKHLMFSLICEKGKQNNKSKKEITRKVVEEEK